MQHHLFQNTSNCSGKTTYGLLDIILSFFVLESCDPPFPEEELGKIGDHLKEFYGTSTRIEMVPWAAGYTVDMQDMYTEVKLEQVENTPTGHKLTGITDCRELFNDVNSDKESCTKEKKQKGVSKIPTPVTKGKKGALLEKKNQGRERDTDKVKISLKENAKGQVPQKKRKGKRILIESDPGLGKTTLSKKIAYDWAMDILRTFAVIFLVSLKLVKPGDSIENIIIHQTPPLEGLNIKQQHLKRLLETFGHRCLLILDGWDEIPKGAEAEILKIITGRKLHYCHVIVTSRPHVTADIGPHVNVKVQLFGFKMVHAKRFIKTVLKDKTKQNKVMRFTTRHGFLHDSKFTSPVLLLFICILIGQDELSQSSKSVTPGCIYARMVRSLYIKYLKRKDVEFDEGTFIDVLYRVGKLAFHSLLSKKPSFQRSQVVQEIGSDAFDYGLLIGHEDFRLIRDETADIYVTFPHMTLQDFLGAFYFTHALDTGMSVESLLGSDCKEPIFMMNPLFFHFCLWFLYSDKDIFVMKDKKSIQERLACFVADRIDVPQLDLAGIADAYFALNISQTFQTNDEAAKSLWKEILSKFYNTKQLLLGIEDPLTSVLESLRSMLKELSLIQLIGYRYQRIGLAMDFRPLTEPCPEDLSLVIALKETGFLHQLSSYLSTLGRGVSMHLVVTGMESKLDLAKFVRDPIEKLYIEVENWINFRVISHPFHERCLALKHLCFNGFLIDATTISALSEAMQQGKLPALSHLSIEKCKAAVKGKLSLLFPCPWPTLTHLNLNSSYLDESDIKVLSEHGNLLPKLSSLVLYLGCIADPAIREELHKIRQQPAPYPLLVRSLEERLKSMVQKKWPCLTSLWLHDMNKNQYKAVVMALNNGNFPALNEFGISMWSLADKERMVRIPLHELKGKKRSMVLIKELNQLERIPSIKITTLSYLSLQRVICTMNHLDWITESSVFTKEHIHKLHKLDISHSSGVTGTLSILLCHSFPSLNSLVLSDCGLNSQDLHSLALASVKDRLPVLRYLNISKNGDLVDGCENLFSSNAQWKKLKHLNFEQENPVSDKNFACLVEKTQIGCLRSLLTLQVSVTEAFCDGHKDVPFETLAELGIHVPQECFAKTLANISDCIERGVFPILNTLRLTITCKPADSQTRFRVKNKLTALKTKLEEFLSKDVAGHAITSVNNSIVNMQNLVHVELTKDFAGQSFESIIPEIFHKTYASLVDETVATLTESITQNQKSKLCAVLLDFWPNFLRIGNQVETAPFIQKVAKFLPVKQRLRRQNIPLFLYVAIPGWNNDSLLDELYELSAPPQRDT